MPDLYCLAPGSRYFNMAEYLHFDRLTVEDFSEKNVETLYDRGYVFTRRGKGVMDQTRSVRIDLSIFELSSENKRILKKNEGLKIESITLLYKNYSWQIGKLAKDFYATKFGDGTFSANKIKEILTDDVKSNFNLLLKYVKDDMEGYAISYESKNILHYSYPFYNLNTATKDLGMGMMLLAILYAKERGKKYIYLGSAQRESDTYKFQFKGIEWFDKQVWSTDEKKLKELLA